MRPAPDKQIIWVPFNKGMRQDLDPTARPTDVPLALEDVIQEKQNKWGSRPGFHRVTRTIDEGNATDDTTLDNARACFSTGGPDAELCIVGDNHLYALNERINKLEARGPVSPFALQQVPVFQDDVTYPSVDMAERDGYALYVAEAKFQTGTATTNFDTALVHMVRSLDGHTVTPLTLQDQTGTAANQYHAVTASSCNGNLLGFAAQNTNSASAASLKFWNWPTGTAAGKQSWTAVGTIVADLLNLGESTRTYAVCPVSNGGFMVAWVDHTNQRITLQEYDDNLTATGNTHTVATNAPYRTLAICEDIANGNILVLTETGNGADGGNIRLIGVDVPGTTEDFNVSVATLSSGQIADALGVAVDNDTGSVACVWNRLLDGGAYVNGSYAESATFSSLGGSSLDQTDVRYNARWISQPWWHDARSYCAIASAVGCATFQTSAALGDHFETFGVSPQTSPWDCNAIVDLRSGEAESDDSRPPYFVGAWDVGQALQAPRRRGCGNSPCPLPKYTRSQPGAPSGDAGLMRETKELQVELGAREVRFMSETSASSLFGLLENVSGMEMRVDYAAPVVTTPVHGGAVAIGGGIISWYDGQRCFELGHACAPVPFDMTAQTSGGQLSDGDYQFVGLWSFTDGRNFVHRSLPSLPAEASLSGGGGLGTLTVSARTNPLTNRYAYQDVVCQWYRGDDDGNYKQSSPPTRIIPNIDSANVTEDYVDTGAYPEARILYSQSELPSFIPEATRIVATIGSRLWGGDCAQWFRVIYSKPTDAGLAGAYGLAPEFNPGFAVQIPGDREVTALGPLDDKAIIWTRESTYVMAGRGPLDNGLQNDFSELTLVDGKIGCIEARSIVEVPSEEGLFPGGVFFQSQAGIYLLTRGLSRSFIGAGVEDDLAEHPIITSASHDKARRLVLFTATNADRSSGVVLVFDYEASAWIRWQPRKAGGDPVVPVGGCMHRGRFHLLEANGQLWKQQAAGEPWAFYDDGWTWVQGAIETADVFGGQPGGRYRLSRFVPVVERYETEGATVGLRVTTIIDGESHEPREISASMVDNWEGQKVPIEVRPPRHRCHTMRIRLESVEGPGAQSGRGLAFSGVLVHARPRQTPAHVSSSQRT